MKTTHPHHFPGGRVFIIEDANGKTVVCNGSMDDLHREAARALLLAPLRVHDWYFTNNPTAHGGWTKREMFVWP